MQDQLVSNYVDAAINQRRRMDLSRWPGPVPTDMIDSSISPMDDWIAWKPIPSTVSDKELDDLESEIGLKYPPLYRQLLKHQHFVDLSEFVLSFEQHLPGDWRKRLNGIYNSWARDRIIDIGLLPFGSEVHMDAGLVCFDTRRREANGDCPIVLWDHGWIETDKEIAPMFSSSQKMFECLLKATKFDGSFFHRHPDDDSKKLAEKRRFLKDWLAIDPLGAGGPAKSYWCAFGVSPDA